MPHYSKWAWMPAGMALNLDLLLVNIIGYRLKVYLTGFDEGSMDYITVFLGIYWQFKYIPEGICMILYKMLDDASDTSQHISDTGNLQLTDG
jgi:hypothetical protein